MKVGFYRDDSGRVCQSARKPDMRGEVDDASWVSGVIDAARAVQTLWGAEYVTARAEDGTRIVTTGLTIHDEFEGP